MQSSRMISCRHPRLRDRCAPAYQWDAFMFDRQEPEQLPTALRADNPTAAAQQATQQHSSGVSRTRGNEPQVRLGATAVCGWTPMRSALEFAP